MLGADLMKPAIVILKFILVVSLVIRVSDVRSFHQKDVNVRGATASIRA